MANQTTTSTVEITPVEGAYLYHRYPGQTSAQPCFVALDLRTGELSADYNPEVGNAVPMNVHHGHVVRWTIPALRGDAVNALLDELAPLAARMVAGYESVWDGSNHVAKLSDDAERAREEIERECYDSAMGDDAISVVDAADYANDAEACGITADTSDDDLVRLADEMRAAASTDGIDLIEGLDERLAELRDAARVSANGDYQLS